MKPCYLYVSMLEGDKILIFTVDPETGKLDNRRELTIPGRPGQMAIDPGRKFLYAGLRGSRQMSAYSIDPITGNLALVNSVPLESDPCSLAIDIKGRFLFSTYLRAGRIAVHSIAEDGAVRSPPVEWLNTAVGAHLLKTNPSNKFAFVAHNATPGRANMIMQFKFDGITGHLTPNPMPSIRPKEILGPRHFCFHPKLNTVYFSNEQGGSVTAYQLNQSNGTLEAFEAISTLPVDYKGENACAEIHMTPSGRFLYVSNRGHQTIVGYAINTSNGRLKLIGWVPTEGKVRGFDIDPGGKFLIAGGQDSGRIASYRINKDTGELLPIETHAVGNSPTCVLIIRAAS